MKNVVNASAHAFAMMMALPHSVDTPRDGRRHDRGRLEHKQLTADRARPSISARPTRLGKVQVLTAPLLHPKFHETRPLELTHRQVHRLLDQARRPAHISLQTAVDQIVEPAQDSEGAVGQPRLHGYVVI